MDLYLGAICAWYPHADTNQEPSVGVVMKIKKAGVFTLYKFPASGGIPTIIDNVHHVDSERVSENENIRLEYGGWDTLEAADQRRPSRVPSPKQATVCTNPVEAIKPEISDDEKKILSCYEQGLTVEEIAKQMGRGWGVKKVGSILREHVQPTV